MTVRSKVEGRRSKVKVEVEVEGRRSGRQRLLTFDFGLSTSRRAYSLVELVAVLAIMAVAMAIAQPRMAGYVTRDRLSRSARRVQMDMRLAQNEAVRRRTWMGVGFSPALDFYAVWRWDPNAITPQAWLRAAASHRIGDADAEAALRDQVVALGADPDYLVGIVSTSFDGNRLVFDAYGIPSAGGSIVLGVGKLRVTVTVNGATGTPTIGDLTQTTAPLNVGGLQRPAVAAVDATRPPALPGFGGGP